MSKLVDGKGICYDVSEPGTVAPKVSISNIPAGTKFYVEPDSTQASSPIASSNRSGGISRRIATLADFRGNDQEIPRRSTLIGQLCARFKADTKQTIEMSNMGMGEHSYVIYEALADNQQLILSSSFKGTIICWNATPLRADETFVDFGDTFTKSIFGSTEIQRPHGPFCAVRGSFLAASLDVKAKLYHQSLDKHIDYLVRQFSMTDNTFQRFSGNGYVMLLAYGGIEETRLHPNQQIDVFPGHLLGFTEGITLEMKSNNDATLRRVEHNDHLIRLTAPEIGGFVYTHSVMPPNFLR